MLERLRQYSEEELIACGNGIDRGVVRPVQTSNDPEPYALTKDQLERIRRKERQRKHYQKKCMARCEKGSRNRAKMRRKSKRVKATLCGKPAKATNIKLGPGWADVMPVEPERCLGKLGCRTRCEAGSPSLK